MILGASGPGQKGLSDIILPSRVTRFMLMEARPLQLQGPCLAVHRSASPPLEPHLSSALPHSASGAASQGSHLGGEERGAMHTLSPTKLRDCEVD